MFRRPVSRVKNETVRNAKSQLQQSLRHRRRRFRPWLEGLEDRIVFNIANAQFLVAGADGSSHVRIFDGDPTSEVGSFFAYAPAFQVGVRVAMGDVNSDGVAEIVTGASAGNPHVKVYDGKAFTDGTFDPANPDASVLTQWFAYGLNFNVGAAVAVGDVDGDGFADVVTGASTGNPHVKIYSGQDIAGETFDPNGNSVIAEWFAYGLNSNVGANVAVGDVNGDGKADIVTGPTVLSSLVKSYDGSAASTGEASVLSQWSAYDETFQVGVYVATGDVNGDGDSEVVTGAGQFGGPHVKAFDGTDGTLLQSFFAFDAGFFGGVRVAVGDMSGDGVGDIIAAAGPSGSPHVKVYDGPTGQQLPSAIGSFFAFDASFTGGVFVGGVSLVSNAPPQVLSAPTGLLPKSVSFFQVTYSEPMATNAFDVASYSLAIDDPPRAGETVTIASVTQQSPSVARIDLAAPLFNQKYEFTISPAVTDLAGNPLAEPTTFQFTMAQPVELSPADHEEMVSPARKIVVGFNEKVDPATVTTEAISLFANGTTLPGSILVSSTELFATFNPTNPLPPSTQVRIMVDGNKIINRDGIAIDADGDGQPGGEVQADFSTLSLTRIPNTNVFGYVYDSYNKNPNGTDRPVVGATIRVDAFPEANAVTDANGYFMLEDMPAPEFFVHIDGSTAINAPEGTVYPSVGKPFHSVPGQTIQLTMDGEPFNIYLPPMSMSDIVPLSDTEPTDVGFGPGGKDELIQMFPNIDPATWDLLKVTYAPNSAIDDNGNPVDQGIVIPVPPDRLPAPLPPSADPKLVISIQAPGATSFDVPAPLTFPNLDNLPPGEKSLLFSFNHDAGRWDVIGTGTVSSDGSVIVSDPGVGIVAPGWHFTQDGTDEEGDGDEDDDDNDDDDDEDVTFEAGIVFAGEFLPIKFFASFGFSLPGNIFDPLVEDPQPMLWEGELTWPLNKIEFGTTFSEQFTVSPTFADFIPEFDITLFNLKGSLSIVGQALAQLSVKGFGLNPIGEISGQIGMNVELQAKGGISDSFICNIPFGIGNFICDEKSVEVPIFGPPLLEIDPPVEVPLPKTPVIDFNETVGPIAQVGVGTELSFSPRIYIKQVSPDNTIAESDASISEVTLSTDDGFGSDPRMYYRYILANGFEIVGRTNSQGEFSAVLPPNMDFNLVMYSPRTNHWQIQTGKTGSSGSSAERNLIAKQWGGSDTDGDGLPDVGEFVIGTSQVSHDTDNDGLSDSVELEQGLNPLDGLAYPSGVVASVPLQAPAEAMTAVGNNIYIANGSKGLAVVDATKFDQPIMQGQLALSGTATGIGVDANLQIAAVATGFAVALVDVSDPVMPTLITTVVTNASRVEVADGFAYVGSSSALKVIDMINGEIVHTINLPGSGSLTGLAREGNYLYAYLSGSDTFSIVDISTPETATVVGQRVVSISASDVGLFVGNDIAWLVGNGLWTVNVTDKTNPVIISPADSTFTASRIALNGSGLAVVAPGSSNYVEIYNVSDPGDTDNFLTRFTTTGNARNVSISRGIATVGTSSRLEVVNYLAFDNKGIAPVVTADTESLEVIEGQTISVQADVTDDVQVSFVDLLVDGVVVSSDVSFPFDFFAVVPPFVEGSATFSIQVRATDTGGNAGVSNVLNLNVLKDTFPPAVLTVDPPPGATLFEGVDTIRVRFSEPLDPSGVTGANIAVVQLTDQGDVPVIAEIELRDDDELVQITTEPLGEGNYELRIDQAAIFDRAGNAMGTGMFVNPLVVQKYLTTPDFYPFGNDLNLPIDDTSYDIGPLPFDLAFFGQAIPAPMRISTNGLLEFGTEIVGGTYTNFSFPHDSSILIAPFFDDIDPSEGGRIGVFDAPGIRAVTWENIPYYDDNNRFVTLQVAVLESGVIEFRYGDMDPMADGSATIGITRGSSAEVPSLGNIENRPALGITDAGGLLNNAGLDLLDELPGNDLLSFIPDGSGGYIIKFNPHLP